MNSFLSELVWFFAVATAVTTVFAMTVRFAWRRGKSLEEP